MPLRIFASVAKPNEPLFVPRMQCAPKPHPRWDLGNAHDSCTNLGTPLSCRSLLGVQFIKLIDRHHSTNAENQRCNSCSWLQVH